MNTVKIYETGLGAVSRPLQSTDGLRQVAAEAETDWIILNFSREKVSRTRQEIESLIVKAESSAAVMAYSDYVMQSADGTDEQISLNDCTYGALRDDFDLGHSLLVRSDALRKAIDEMPDYEGAALYDMRLRLTHLYGLPLHVCEPLYTVVARRDEDEGERQFDYVNPRNRAIQIEMERACTDYLRSEDALVPEAESVEAAGEWPVEASVIIPVRNREHTIADAVCSALSQRTDFVYNVIVVDNHSTDGTTRAITEIDDPRLVHIIPESRDLGIGGCWNRAIGDSRCGRYAVQLDSDDLYSGPDTLQRIVDTFRSRKCAMVIGSYSLTDFELQPLPPGLIDHREWTDSNGANNALRINGLGAPRAFVTALARRYPFPDVSYGEDYAMGLRLSRNFRIGRIYDCLYLCRRWSGNSDHALSRDRVNANNRYKDSLREAEFTARKELNARRRTVDSKEIISRQLAGWVQARETYAALGSVLTRQLGLWRVQCNPARIGSTAAKISGGKVQDERPCFLCRANRPEAQISLGTGDYELLVNPFPVFSPHFTIVSKEHKAQMLEGHVADMALMAVAMDGYTVFYNGARCGASAPDHLHFQAVKSEQLPLWQHWDSGVTECGPMGFVGFEADGPDSAAFMLGHLMSKLPSASDGEEAPVNVLMRSHEGRIQVAVIPRRAHRPSCYAAEGNARLLCSPGAIDVAGVLILPREEDFVKIDEEKALEIIKEVTFRAEDLQGMLSETPIVRVGLMTREEVTVTFNGSYVSPSGRIYAGHYRFNAGSLASPLLFIPSDPECSVTVDDVTIGVDFHWQRCENQVFSGALELLPHQGRIVVINRVDVETYLRSVISSEMNSHASAEFLRAHAVISRSWLMSQLAHKGCGYEGECLETEAEVSRWWDHDDHTLFDVCADDHCQRYQGITRVETPHAVAAVESTRGQVLTYGGDICDARFSKCCGGVTEEFATCWQPVNPPYLQALCDDVGEHSVPDLPTEAGATRWIEERPRAYCNTSSAEILRSVLNSYDLETPDFYRWSVTYTAGQLADIVRQRTGIDYGMITAIEPLHRGKSGRIDRLRLVGTKHSRIIGKELEIRRSLSLSHLYSSAFIAEPGPADADGVPGCWTLRGAGWGHGVGLCQIGAAVMAHQGIGYQQILAHYFPGASLTRRY